MQNNQKFDWKKYFVVFVITACLFVFASFLSNYFGSKKINELRSLQNKIALDILSSETQYSLLSELSCRNLNYSALSEELSELGKKIEWSEENLRGAEEVQFLRKYYSLLQIKDYLLMKKISERCDKQYAFVLYFYTTADNCSDCIKTSLVLSRLRSDYPDLRVYSFDYSTDLSAVEAMLRIFKIEDTKLPAIVLEDEVLVGFQSLEDLSLKIEKTFKISPNTAEKQEAS